MRFTITPSVHNSGLESILTNQAKVVEGGMDMRHKQAVSDRPKQGSQRSANEAKSVQLSAQGSVFRIQEVTKSTGQTVRLIAVRWFDDTDVTERVHVFEAPQYQANNRSTYAAVFALEGDRCTVTYTNRVGGPEVDWVTIHWLDDLQLDPIAQVGGALG